MKPFPLFYIIIFLLPSLAFPIYDSISIDIVPTESEMKFCFNPDYRQSGNTYLAVQMSSEFYFISLNSTGLELSQWQPGIEPPFFAERKGHPTCLGPFTKSSLQNISVYAGVGTSLGEMLETQKYRKIFNGAFITLPQAPTDWTVMIYMVGSDLESSRSHWASQDILEMLEGSSHSTKVNVVLSSGGSTRSGWQTVKRIFIQNGQQYVLQDIGATSMADPQTLTDFVTWATHQFPAQHDALILWNHGDGANGYGYDTSEAGGGKIMTLPELHQAYQTIRQQLGHPLDIVVYDACLMASIEVAEVTSTVAEAMAASAELEPGHGLHYAHLLENLGGSPPANGVDFGRLVKTGYLQQTRDTGTFEKSPITYSVFDLTQLPSLTTTLKQFATEFKNILEKTTFLNYERLSHGIIRAPGYPFKQTGRLKNLEDTHIRIDLYGVLQTVLPEFPEFKAYADELLAQLDHTVVDYEGNLADVSPSAGRVSIDIGRDKSYLTVLPEAYTLLSDGLDFYNHQKQADLFEPESELVPHDCPSGLVCAALPNWLELQSEDILGVEAYLGQQVDQTAQIYLIQSLYQRGETDQNLELGIRGEDACRYQICVNQATCEGITVTKQRNVLLAEVLVNEREAILSFCQSSPERWTACSLVQRNGEIWGREEQLVPEDRVVPHTLTLQGGELQQQTGQSLEVNDSAEVTLQKDCQEATATIFAAYYSLNNHWQFAQLCVGEGCKQAGVYIKE